MATMSARVVTALSIVFVLLTAHRHSFIFSAVNPTPQLPDLIAGLQTGSAQFPEASDA